MTQEQEQMEITDGPSELDLVYALMRGETVTFTIEGVKVPTIINAMEIEDGSRKSWLIKGRFEMLNGPGRDKFMRNNFYGWYAYNRGGRKGYVKIG